MHVPGDDINKFLWMVRIAEGEHPKEIHEANYFTESGDYSVGVKASETMLNSVMYKTSYYRFGDVEVTVSRAPRNQLSKFCWSRDVAILDILAILGI